MWSEVSQSQKDKNCVIPQSVGPSVVRFSDRKKGGGHRLREGRGEGVMGGVSVREDEEVLEIVLMGTQGKCP